MEASEKAVRARVEATARPWRMGLSVSDKRPLVISLNNVVMAKMLGGGSDGAALIVRAVNAHEALVEACGSALRMIESGALGQQAEGGGSSRAARNAEMSLSKMLIDALAEAGR